METVSICATMTSDQEILAAAALHDILEDTSCTAERLQEEFGPRVTAIVVAETQSGYQGQQESSWHERRAVVIERLAQSSLDSQLVALGDKLSNMRAIWRDYKQCGDALWKRFSQPDAREHEWYYRSLADALSPLQGEDAYEEFVRLMEDTCKR